MLSIHKFPNPILKRPTRDVARIDKSIQRLISDMVSLMRSQPRCVGVAAPQVGKSVRIAAMDASRHPKVKKAHGLLILINPTILTKKGSVIQREGCLSVPDFTGDVKRAEQVRIRALGLDGMNYELTLEGFEAIVAQHEIDHLDGLLFLDRVANPRTDIFKRKKYL